MFRSLTNYNFPTESLENRTSTRNPIVDGDISHLVDLFQRISLVHAKGFDGEHEIVIFLIGEPPNISESSRRKWSWATLAERGGNCVGGGKDSV